MNESVPAPSKCWRCDQPVAADSLCLQHWKEHRSEAMRAFEQSVQEWEEWQERLKLEKRYDL